MKTINNSEGQGRYPLSECLPHPNYFTIKIDLGKELKMNQELGTIYVATNLINGKQYVGQTTRKLKERITSHKTSQRCRFIHRAIKKYGIENFKWISYSCPEKGLDWHERFLIRELNTLAPNGYNLDSGGNEQKHMSEESRKLMSKNHADFSGKNHPQYGKLSPTLSERNKKRIGVLHPNFGKHWPKETTQKMSEIKKGKKYSLEHNKNLSISRINKEVAKGEKNPNAKLTIDKVEKIRQSSLKYREISKLFNISISQVGKIKINKEWK